MACPVCKGSEVLTREGIIDEKGNKVPLTVTNVHTSDGRKISGVVCVNCNTIYAVIEEGLPPRLEMASRGEGERIKELQPPRTHVPMTPKPHRYPAPEGHVPRKPTDEEEKPKVEEEPPTEDEEKVEEETPTEEVEDEKEEEPTEEPVKKVSVSKKIKEEKFREELGSLTKTKLIERAKELEIKATKRWGKDTIINKIVEIKLKGVS